MSVDFKQTFIHMDVLCVSHYLEYILAGIGNRLFIYQEKLLLTQAIFTDERIHSIIIKGDAIVLKGCRKFSLIKIKPNLDGVCVEIIGNIQSCDFIQDVVVTDDELIGLVTAHNCFQLWDVRLEKCLEMKQCVENCILYSCKIIGNSMKNITIFAGTVFGNVLIWSPIVNENPLKRLDAHNGAVFSIEVKPDEKLITTTSDDRSLKIWSVSFNSPPLDPHSWEESSIQLNQTLFGHTARVWKSLILQEHFITIGEDSQLILWDKDGQVVRALSLHQESGIRALHYTPKGVITTGGEDGGINQFPIEWLTCCSKPTIKSLVADGSTKICFTDRGIVYVVNGTCVVDDEVVYKNVDFGSYSVLDTSPGHIVIGSIKGRIVVLNLDTKMVEIDEHIMNGRIFAIHCLEGRLLTCGPNGRLDIWEFNDGMQHKRTMTLPPCKERWTTCAIMQGEKLIVGDRMGTIHVFDSSPDPIKSFRKIHSYLGVTDMRALHDGWVSAGRDGTVKTFTNLQHTLTCKLPMDWPWRIVPHDKDTLLLGFHSVLFIVWSMNNREIIASHDCGGGHRSCDFKITNNTLTFLYVKDKKVQKVNLKLNHVKRVRNGFHGKEINCLKILQTRPVIVITGSEDTTVRISTIENDIKPVHVLTNHVSSVRDVTAVPIDAHKYLITSVGGKGQIAIYEFHLVTKQCKLLVNHRLKTETRNWKAQTPSIDPETRIMCVDVKKCEKYYAIAAGCSDCYVRLFEYDGELRESLSMAYTHCILNVKFVGGLLASMGTDGRVVFWDHLNGTQLKNYALHQSGINSFQFVELEKGRYVLVTGGDDNLICASGVDISGEVNLVQLWGNNMTHSCQITGMKILNNYLITTSVDQRITIWKWSWKDEFKMEFQKQCMTSVPDIQGMDATCCEDDRVTVIVHGKGIQALNIDLHSRPHI